MDNIFAETAVDKIFWSDRLFELDEDEILLETVNNYNNEEVVIVKKDGKDIYLNSMYDVDAHTMAWTAGHNVSNPFSVAVVFGLGDGRYIRQLRNINRDMIIAVYEPSVKIARYVRNTGRLEDIINQKLYILCGQECLSDFIELLGAVISYSNRNYVKYYVSPNYDRLYPKDVKDIRNIVGDYITNLYFGKNTKRMLGRSILGNVGLNLTDCVVQYSLSDYVNALKIINKEHIPAILVSAGPSLDKNIHELKNAVGKAFIIAVDTALNALAKVGIIPDIAVTVDPEKPVELFSNPLMLDVPLIFHLMSAHDILSVHKGRRIYQQTIGSPLNVLYKKYNKITYNLETGGSVANDAYSLARHAGFKTIIFIGQDLAFPNDQEHASDTFGKDYDDSVDNRHYKYIYVDDIYGNPIRTVYSMNKYRLWFETEIIRHPEIRFIDATEGGAKINGTEIMTLKQAIDELCINDKLADFHKITDDIQCTFTEEEREEAYRYIAGYGEEFNHIIKKVRDGITLYDKLEEYNNKQNYSGKGFMNTFNKITELNKWITKSPEISYISNYTSMNEYEVLENVFDEKNSVYEELKLIVESGRKTLQGILDVKDIVLEDLKPAIREAQEILHKYYDTEPD